uniref:glycosyltransferase family 117 protein n=2 Tax=Algoriphagus sp. TaxID=1872435 RepID=UPI0040473143
MLTYKQINTLSGWLVFAISTLVYVLTVEQTASFWDPGEFVAVSYKLQVPHPPGAPFMLLVYRMFGFLAFGDPLQVAYWMNVGSALFSGFTILFLFWSITLMGKRLFAVVEGEESKGQTIALMGAGLVGSLVYTFSDSFWFSAVEAEVYAMSSFFTAIVIWAFLKWDVIKDPREENRWLVFIAYLVGLSIGVHLLNLVTLPGLALIYYFKKYPKPNLKGGIIAMFLGGVALICINNLIIPGLPSLAGSMEIWMVNSLGLPFGSGIIIFVLLFVSALLLAFRISFQRELVVFNTILLSLTFILIGYGSYALIVVRANQDPIINESAPKDIISYVSYLKREQYGYRPLLHGQYFTATLVDQEEGDPIYMKGKNSYEIVDYDLKNTYDPEKTTILPRIYSTQESHKRIYRSKLGLKEGQEPTFGDNLYFMFSHQLGHMYWRYFLWNFSGRESDFSDANWLGIGDAFSDVYPDYIKENKGHNNYLMLPLILGLVGFFFQAKKDQKYFYVNLMLFLMMGVVLVLYLNSPPIEPRERDYIYVGSFYAFAIWIGLGALALAHSLNKFTKNLGTAGLVATLLTLPIAGLMAAENWDDHNRKGRYFSVDAARNFLASCAPNAILFTGGDNDTFPLWYVQEVENFRTDVRVIVLSYFDTDWYVEQMTRQTNDSKPLPFSLSPDRYQKGTNDVLYVMEREGLNAISAKEYLKLINSGSELLQMKTSGRSVVNMVPSRNLILEVDSSFRANDEIVPPQFKDLFVSQLNLQVGGNYVTKGTLMLLDLIVSNNWERPIYFNNTSLSTIGLNISEHVVMEGLTYRLLPIQKPNSQREELVNTDLALKNYMENFAFRGMNDSNVYLDEEYRRFTSNHRSALNSIALALLDENRMEDAAKLLNFGLETIPDKAVPYDLSSGQSVPLFFEVGEDEKALEIIEKISKRSLDRIEFNTKTNRGYDRDMLVAIEMIKYFIPLLEERGYQEKGQALKERLEKWIGNESEEPSSIRRR